MSALLDSTRKGKKITYSLHLFHLTMFIFACKLQYTLTVVARGRVTPALEMPRYITTMFLPMGFTLGGIVLINFILNLTSKDEIY